MSKIALENVQTVLAELKIEPDKQDKILQELQKIIEDEKNERAENKAPKSKNEFGVILYDANNELAGKEFTASVFQVKQGFDFNTVLSKISTAARNQNVAAKRKKNVIETIGDACMYLKRKFTKEQEVNIKTKEPIRVLISSNRLV